MHNNIVPADLILPVISDLQNVSVPCGQDYSPAAVGRPNVTDNEDESPTSRYTDRGDGCTVVRTWTVSDRAGNQAISQQLIRFTDLQAPVVSSPTELIVPCGSVEDASALLAHNNISVSHPCNRSVTFHYRDSADLRCGFTFSRIWQVNDDCGLSTIFTQTIRVLDQQSADTPRNGQINVALLGTLRWPQFPGATAYRVYIWPESAGERPSVPVAVVHRLRYTPTIAYPPGTRMLWQIEYVLENGTFPSPVWGFETESRPDLEVTDVTVPSSAFSGQSFGVRWTVTNVGNLSVTRFFYDALYLNRLASFQGSRFLARVEQRRFLDPGDGYSFEMEVNLREDDIGMFHVFVDTDSSNDVSLF